MISIRFSVALQLSHLQVAVVLLSKHRVNAGIKRTDTEAQSNLTRSAPRPLRYYFLLGRQYESIA